MKHLRRVMTGLIVIATAAALVQCPYGPADIGQDAFPCTTDWDCPQPYACPPDDGSPRYCYRKGACAGDPCVQGQVCVHGESCETDRQWARFPISETPSLGTASNGTVTDDITRLTWLLMAERFRAPPAACPAGYRVASANEVLSLTSLADGGAVLPAAFQFIEADGGAAADATRARVVTNTGRCSALTETECAQRWTVHLGEPSVLLDDQGVTPCNNCWFLCTQGGR